MNKRIKLNKPLRKEGLSVGVGFGVSGRGCEVERWKEKKLEERDGRRVPDVDSECGGALR